jgi:hypothetical protein
MIWNPHRDSLKDPGHKDDALYVTYSQPAYVWNIGLILVCYRPLYKNIEISKNWSLR